MPSFKVLHEKATLYLEHKAKIKALEAEAKGVQKEFLAELERRGVSTMTVGGDISITKVKQSSVNFDASMVEELIPSEIVEEYSIIAKVVDQSSLDLAIKAGKVRPEEVASAAQVTHKAAYAKVTRKK